MAKKIKSTEIIGPIDAEGGMMLDVELGMDHYTCCWLAGNDALTAKGEEAFQQFCDYMNANQQILLFNGSIIVVGTRAFTQQDIISTLQQFENGDIVCFQGHYEPSDHLLIRAGFNVIDTFEVEEMSQLERQLVGEATHIQADIISIAKRYPAAPMEDTLFGQLANHIQQHCMQLTLITNIAEKRNGGFSGEGAEELNNLLMELDYGLKDSSPWVHTITQQHLPASI
ncbi:hypothetical protein H0A36_25770 [Endozoicomonas sp. SM1973]|uniref:Uncharacterized protein n=1 Tax=Spartinivicinus marinus TaxID=2994442 RepID=A0A853IFW0_9GAMM|nr:hypothetical protein [Spartinivicinus marinus]MCX4030273.1 hypothetical protein [Spartinivicinus marinus]MCX4030424.1 hypothetical protein [Spartinivicinus marinus]NYZ69428.1 hypothetical protein [Spartinivicinus marinus]